MTHTYATYDMLSSELCMTSNSVFISYLGKQYLRPEYLFDGQVFYFKESND